MEVKFASPFCGQSYGDGSYGNEREVSEERGRGRERERGRDRKEKERRRLDKEGGPSKTNSTASGHSQVLDKVSHPFLIVFISLPLLNLQCHT